MRESKGNYRAQTTQLNWLKKFGSRSYDFRLLDWDRSMHAILLSPQNTRGVDMVVSCSLMAYVLSSTLTGMTAQYIVFPFAFSAHSRLHWLLPPSHPAMVSAKRSLTHRLPSY
jgi:hypothetical protein